MHREPCRGGKKSKHVETYQKKIKTRRDLSDFQSHFNILNLKILRCKDSRGNETCHLWQRSTSEKLEVGLFEMYIRHGGSLFAYFYLFLC